ncbi:unnamed protein product, partial [Iphiclides podalirius]
MNRIKWSLVIIRRQTGRSRRGLQRAGLQEVGLKSARAGLRNRYVRGERGLQGLCAARAGPGRGGEGEGAVGRGRRRRESIPIRSPARRSNMADKNKVAEQYYAPPPDLGKWEGFRIFLWNSETGQFLGRTGSSWAKILLFYLIFYAILVGFFAALLAIFYQTLDYKTPKWQMDGSLIGNNPAGVLINIECKAWAKNIQYDRYERRGSVHFELMVDRS